MARESPKKTTCSFSYSQEWPPQTKPKKGQFMNFSQGHSETKVQCESCLVSQGITPEFTKMSEFMNFSYLGTKKSTQTFFVQSFSRTLRVMDVRAENRGRPHQKVRFSAASVMGRNFLTQGRPGIRVRDVRGKSGPKCLCLCCFFFPEINSARLIKNSL